MDAAVSRNLKVVVDECLARPKLWGNKLEEPAPNMVLESELDP